VSCCAPENRGVSGSMGSLATGDRDTGAPFARKTPLKPRPLSGRRSVSICRTTALRPTAVTEGARA
jgi:hypothetical protein